MRLIDADLLYKAMQDAEELARRRVRDTESTLPYPTNLNPAYTRYLAQMDERTKAKKMVADAQTVDAVPVRRGRWKHKKDLKQFFCDQCGEPSLTEDDVYFYDMEFPNFCPNCGAKMDWKDGDRT